MILEIISQLERLLNLAVMKVVVRLPNWLGDLVMSTGFMHHLHQVYPQATIDVVIKKGLDGLMPYLPMVRQVHVFDKALYPGLKGIRKFAKQYLKPNQYDLAFCLPESFSSAAMFWNLGIKNRVGFKKEFRSWMLTSAYHRPKHLHRVRDYLMILEQYSGIPCAQPEVFISPSSTGQNGKNQRKSQIVVNVNSEAESRRLPVDKAVSILNLLINKTDTPILLVGSPKELPHVEAVYQKLSNPQQVKMLAGKTSLPDLVALFAETPVMLTTDSGPMHLANSVGVYTVALEGASDERSTAPWNANKSSLIRFGGLACEPCVKNTCQFGLPKCLLSMNNEFIVQEVLQAYAHQMSLA